MDLRIFTEPQQGADHDDLLRVARTAEDAGYDGFFRSDHLLAMGEVSGEPGPSDAWLTLAALATQTSRLRLGTLVTSATFRLPGVLAVAVAQVDAMSGGRVELGLGAGWYEAEHTAYGIEFPAVGERFDRLTEQLEIITGMWATLPGQRYSFAGRHYTVTDSPALPKPVQTRVPMIIGGKGRVRTPQLAARFADEFNVPLTDLDSAVAQFDRVRAAAGDKELVLSAALVTCVGRDDAEVATRAATLGRDVDELRTVGVVGSVAQAVDTLGRWRERAGVTRVYLQLLDLADLDQVELIGAEVAPQLS